MSTNSYNYSRRSTADNAMAKVIIGYVVVLVVCAILGGILMGIWYILDKEYIVDKPTPDTASRKNFDKVLNVIQIIGAIFILITIVMLMVIGIIRPR